MAKTTLFSDIETNEELAANELESGSTGGGYVSKCGVYPMTIEKAFLTKTQKGGVKLDIHCGGENIFNGELYPVSVDKKTGKKTTSYTYKGKSMSLGDYKLLKQLLFVTNGKPIDLADMETVTETITYKAYGKDVTVEAETCVDLVGKDINMGVRLEERYRWDSEEEVVDKTQLKTNDDGDVVYDKKIFSVYSQSGKTPTEIIKNSDAKQVEDDRKFLEGDKGIKKVKLEAVEFEDDIPFDDDGTDPLNF